MTGDARRDNRTLPDQDTTQKRLSPRLRSFTPTMSKSEQQRPMLAKEIPHLSAALIGKYISDLQQPAAL